MAGDKPWPEAPVGNKDHTQAAVVIVGAGISGMCTAIDLIKRNNCRNFIIVEKSSGVGGTWYDNRYPGCCCDVYSMLYSFSFEQKPDWTREYPGQEEILEYLTGIAQKYNLYQHIRFNTYVEEARWDEAALKWKTKVSTVGGSKEAEANPGYEISSDFLVSAVGQLNVPKWPDAIPGLRDFQGKMMHSARWDWSYDLSNKRIAVIGNGATAVQIIPELQKVASHLTVFQRTPNWVVPRMDAQVPAYAQTLMKYIPPLRVRKRSLQMDFRESTYDGLVNPSSFISSEFRRLCLEQMHSALPNNPEIWSKLTPNYSPGCKRILISDDYYPALAQPNVHLETRPISHIHSSGITIRTSEETEESQPYDLIVLATGFQTLSFLHSIKVFGVSGRPLNEIWSRGATALYGVLAPSLPNFGMLYGPNSNLGHNSIILMIEAQSRYINALISRVLSARRQGQQLALCPKQERVDEYNAWIQKRLEGTSFADPSCQSWYKNEEGLITNNWCGTVVEYQKLLEVVRWGDFEVQGDGKEKVESEGKETYIGRVKEETTFSSAAVAVMGVASLAGAVAGVAAVVGVLNGRGLRGMRLRVR
ncbi:FAD-binding monooxygenase-like protein 4 [Elsinoe australis]|uniref:FAD-binding monooxygenase-like protein 4 n=1 Tax=Elsinoe australis TaxID=40998 RepID=A0A4U7B0A2_9PEZI|nr:FAD-binding monooxygenase-like protein 4 [Elsinoe australis]